MSGCCYHRTTCALHRFNAQLAEWASARRRWPTVHCSHFLPSSGATSCAPPSLLHWLLAACVCSGVRTVSVQSQLQTFQHVGFGSVPSHKDTFVNPASNQTNDRQIISSCVPGRRSHDSSSSSKQRAKRLKKRLCCKWNILMRVLVWLQTRSESGQNTAKTTYIVRKYLEEKIPRNSKGGVSLSHFFKTC